MDTVDRHNSTIRDEAHGTETNLKQESYPRLWKTLVDISTERTKGGPRSLPSRDRDGTERRRVEWSHGPEVPRGPRDDAIGGGVVERPLLHVISHTDLDGVAAAALAWHVHRIDRAPVRVSLTGYGEVDNLILETLDGLPCRAPSMEPASPSACVSASLFLCVSHE